MAPPSFSPYKHNLSCKIRRVFCSPSFFFVQGKLYIQQHCAVPVYFKEIGERGKVILELYGAVIVSKVPGTFAVVAQKRGKIKVKKRTNLNDMDIG